MLRIIAKLFGFWPKPERTFAIDEVCDAQIIDLKDDSVFQNVRAILADVCQCDPGKIMPETELLEDPDLLLDWQRVDKILYRLRDVYPEVPFPTTLEGLLGFDTVADIILYIHGYHGKAIAYR